MNAYIVLDVSELKAMLAIAFRNGATENSETIVVEIPLITDSKGEIQAVAHEAIVCHNGERFSLLRASANLA